MIIKLIIIIATLLMLVLFLTNRSTSRTRASVKLALVGFVLIAILVTLLPEVANNVAHAVGVGRGTDLLLYIQIVAFMFLVLSLYIRSKDENKRIVSLARKLAIMEANASLNKSKK
jgi:hypothetical protein